MFSCKTLFIALIIGSLWFRGKLLYGSLFPSWDKKKLKSKYDFLSRNSSFFLVIVSLCLRTLFFVSAPTWKNGNCNILSHNFFSLANSKLETRNCKFTHCSSDFFSQNNEFSLIQIFVWILNFHLTILFIEQKYELWHLSHNYIHIYFFIYKYIYFFFSLKELLEKKSESWDKFRILR